MLMLCGMTWLSGRMERPSSHPRPNSQSSWMGLTGDFVMH